MGVSRADNSVKNWPKNLPISNPKPDLHNINAHTVWWKSIDVYSSYHLETKIWACLGQITPSKIDEICPLAIPNQISTISMPTPSLVKIHWCLLKLSSGNEKWTNGRTTDGQTDRLTEDQRETIIPCHYCVAGYNKNAWYFTSLSTLLKSYWDDGRVRMKGSVRWRAIQSSEFCRQLDLNWGHLVIRSPKR